MKLTELVNAEDLAIVAREIYEAGFDHPGQSEAIARVHGLLTPFPAMAGETFETVLAALTLVDLAIQRRTAVLN
jgi:hypothetical protein